MPTHLEYANELAKRDARIRDLLRALKPFCDAADYFDSHRQRLKDDDALFHHESVGAEAKITLGDLRSARTAAHGLR